MGLLEEAIQSKKAREASQAHADRDAALAAEKADLTACQTYEQSVQPELERMADAYLESVPDGLLDLFEEMRRAIEKKAGIELQKRTRITLGWEYEQDTIENGETRTNPSVQYVQENGRTIARVQTPSGVRMNAITSLLTRSREGTLDELHPALFIDYTHYGESQRCTLRSRFDKASARWQMGGRSEGVCDLSDLEGLAQRFTDALDEGEYLSYPDRTDYSTQNWTGS